MARKGNGDSWRWKAGGTGRTTISVIETPDKEKPEGARTVPFGFGPRDEPSDDVDVAEARLSRAWDEVVAATRGRNEARRRARDAARAERRARD